MTLKTSKGQKGLSTQSIRRSSKDIDCIRVLAEQYAELAAQPVQEDRRKLWAVQNSLKKTRPLILV